MHTLQHVRPGVFRKIQLDQYMYMLTDAIDTKRFVSV